LGNKSKIFKDKILNGGNNMTVEQIAIRQEVRQMLNEAGINKNTLKDMVKEVLEEEMQKAIKHAVKEMDFESRINDSFSKRVDGALRTEIRDQIKDRICSVFNRMTISVDVTDKSGMSSISR
jgi:hypothetical protein